MPLKVWKVPLGSGAIPDQLMLTLKVPPNELGAETSSSYSSLLFRTLLVYASSHKTVRTLKPSALKSGACSSVYATVAWMSTRTGVRSSHRLRLASTMCATRPRRVARSELVEKKGTRSQESVCGSNDIGTCRVVDLSCPNCDELLSEVGV